MSWRTLKRDLKKFIKSYPELSEHAVKAEEKWRKILLNDELDTEYEHHFLLFDYIDQSPENLPDNFQGYMMRGTDATIAFSSKTIFLFSKLPAMVFVSSISPKEINQNWEGTWVGKSGIIKTPQECRDPEIGSLLINRAKVGNKNPLSGRHNERIKETMLKDLDRVKGSKSYELWLEESKRKSML